MADTKSTWAGEGWVWRVIRLGLLGALVIGIPVGCILAFGTSQDELPGGSRSMAVAIFVLLTAVWTVPMAFLLRWRVKRAMEEQNSGPVPGDGP